MHYSTQLTLLQQLVTDIKWDKCFQNCESFISLAYASNSFDLSDVKLEFSCHSSFSDMECKTEKTCYFIET